MKNKGNTVYVLCAVIPVLLILFVIIFAFYQRNIIADRYNSALRMMKTGDYSSALELLNSLQDYKNSNELKEEVENELLYEEAYSLLGEQRYSEAVDLFSKIKDFKDSSDKIIEAKYNIAIQAYEKGDYNLAKRTFIETDGYLESEFYLAQINIKTIEQSKRIVYEKSFNTDESQ